MRLNQIGAPVQEDYLCPDNFKPGELEEAVCLLVTHLGLDLVRTNATKHGNTELRLRKDGADV